MRVGNGTGKPGGTHGGARPACGRGGAPRGPGFPSGRFATVCVVGTGLAGLTLFGSGCVKAPVIEPKPAWVDQDPATFEDDDYVGQSFCVSAENLDNLMLMSARIHAAAKSLDEYCSPTISSGWDSGWTWTKIKNHGELIGRSFKDQWIGECIKTDGGRGYQYHALVYVEDVICR